MNATYGPAIDSLLTPPRLCDLGPGQPNEPRRKELSALTVATAFAGQQVVAQDFARCCLAGLWLLHDFLDESHQLSQEIETSTGSYWHGIMHRREPDYGNSKYWFRRVGQHPIFPQLLTEAQGLIEAAGANDREAQNLLHRSDWDPFPFIDWCAALARGTAQQTELAQQIAQAEWRLLFEFGYRRALGESIGPL